MLLRNFLLTLLSSISLSSAFTIKREDNETAAVTQGLEQIWDYGGDTKIQGISLGGWFVLEPYITPSLFTQFGSNDSLLPVDEYTFTETLGKDQAKEQLEAHWSTYYTESDFKDIKNYGFNTVRIPIGYWAFYILDDDPYVQGQEKYIDNALEWAEQNDLKVWIDLHGVPGSQNGFDNSGKRGAVEWQDEEENILLSYETLNYIFKKYGSSDYYGTVTGIEIVNEPLSPKLNDTDLLDFYYNSYYDYRVAQESENYFAIQDAFFAIGYWNTHLNQLYPNVSAPYLEQLDYKVPEDYFKGVVVDHHHYEVFTVDQLQKSSSSRVQDIRNYAASIGKEQQYHPSLIGEFSAAITDCAKWLNGVGTGARYDGTFDESQLVRNSPEDTAKFSLNSTIYQKSTETRTCSNLLDYDDFTEEHKQDIGKFIEIQLLEYEKNSAGWIFWNYKTEDAIEWDFKKLNEKGLFPQPFDNYQYFYRNGTEIVQDDEEESSALSGFRFNLYLVMGACAFIGTALF